MLNEKIAQLKLALISPYLLQLAIEIRSSGRSFLGYPRLYSLAEGFLSINKRNPGSVQAAEFGVGRGGSAMILAWMINKFGGELHLFDIYKKIPPPSIADGIRAQERYEKITNSENTNYYGNINDLLSVIKEDLKRLCSLDRIHFIRGKFEDSLQNYTLDKEFNLIHIDCDWYESTRAVLNYLPKNLSRNAIIQIDDYDFWPGTKQAVQESQWIRNRPYKIIEGAMIVDLKNLELWN